MFAKLKVRARLILVRQRLYVFFNLLLFFILRFVLFLLILGSLISLFFVISQRSDYLSIGYAHYFLICFLLVTVFLILTYFYGLIYIRRCLFFEKVINKNKGYEKREESFKEEICAGLRVLSTSFSVALIKLAWFVFFCSPAFVLLAIIIFKLYSGGIAENVLNISVISAACLFIFGSLFYFCLVQRYFLAIRMAGLKKHKPFEAIRESAKTIDSWSANIAIFKIGISLWYILCLFFVPAFYILPYSRLSFELLCEKYMGKNTEDINMYSTKKLPKI